MPARAILALVGGALLTLAAFNSVRRRRVDLQSRIWFLTGALLWVVSAWLWSRS